MRVFKGMNYNKGKGKTLPLFCVFLVLILALSLVLTGCGDDASIGVIGGEDGPSEIIVSGPLSSDDEASADGTEEKSAGTEGGGSTLNGDVPESPGGSMPDSPVSAAVPEEPAEPVYDYAKPVPSSLPVEDSFFGDAVFVGDSRTEGFALYSGLAEARAYTSRGLKVDTIFTKEAVKIDDKKLPVMEALAKTEFSKVYLMLGINEMGWVYPEVFAEKYGEVVDGIRAINPEAQIYVESLLPVTKKKDDEGGDINNKRIEMYNDLIKKMAVEKEVYYLDIAFAMKDESGCLPEDAAFDGIHLKKEYCQRWLEYLKSHVVGEPAAPEPDWFYNPEEGPGEPVGDVPADAPAEDVPAADAPAVPETPAEDTVTE